MFRGEIQTNRPGFPEAGIATSVNGGAIVLDRQRGTTTDDQSHQHPRRDDQHQRPTEPARTPREDEWLIRRDMPRIPRDGKQH